MIRARGFYWVRAYPHSEWEVAKWITEEGDEPFWGLAFDKFAYTDAELHEIGPRIDLPASIGK